MSFKARRLIEPKAVMPFGWQTAAGSLPAPAIEAPPEPEPVPEEPKGPTAAETAAHLAALERDAFTQGYASGERAGNENAAKRGEAMLRRLTQTLEELTAVRADMIRHTERQMVQLALAVARRIVHREVSLDQDLLIAMARVALDRLGDSAVVTIRLHPDDFEATRGAHKGNWEGTNVTVVGDARVGRGGCRVESDFGTLDAGVDAQIQELGRALLGEETPTLEPAGEVPND